MAKSEKKKYKYTRVGTVLASKNEGGGSYIALGDPKNENEKYQYSVEIIVRDAKGAIVKQQTNGFISCYDPRRNRDNVPDMVLFELSLSEEV